MPTGRKRRHWEMPDMWVTCALGPYNFEFMTEVTKEIVATFPEVGGIFSNRWEGSGMCYCEHCARNFRDYCGMDLPRTNNQRDPARRNYIVWREARLFELWRLWDGEIRKINPAARYIANSGGANGGLDMRVVGELAPTLFADRQGRSGVMAPWANGKNGKEYRSTLGRKPIGGIFHMGVVTPHRWPDSVQNGNETRIWVLDGVANGLRPWFNKVGASVHDHRWLKVVEDLYVWHWKNERYLRNEEPVARVALVYSQQTTTWYGGPQARQKVEDFSLGMYHALIEARMPFEMLHDRTLDTAGRFKLLLLPNIAALSNEQCAQIRRFVEGGGSVLATYETSLYDETGERRADFGLADVFGVSWRKTLDGPIPNSYLRVEDKRAPPSRDEGPGGRRAAHQRDVPIGGRADRPVRAAVVDRDPAVPQPADGEEHLGRQEDRQAGDLLAHVRQGTRGLLSLGYRPRLLGGDGGRSRTAAAQRDRLGSRRGAARHRGGTGRARRDGVEAEEFDDRPPGEPHQPDDDAAEFSRDDSLAAPAGPSPAARRQASLEGPVSGRRDSRRAYKLPAA